MSTSRRDWLSRVTQMSAFTVAGVGGRVLPAGWFPAGATEFDRVLGTPAGGASRRYAPEVVRMDRNESPYGPSPKAVAAIAAALGESHRYAHEPRDDLKTKLAKMNAVAEDHIFVGNGSTEPMGLIAGALFRSGGEVLSCDRTFGVLQRNVERLGGKWVKVPLDTDARTDLQALLRAVTPATKAVYICNPNNPTGTVVAANVFVPAVRELSKKCLVVVDEAYADYLMDQSTRADVMSLVRAGENVCILRTFSKIHALAAGRVGAAFARPELIAQLRRGEYGTQMVPGAGLVGAIASLDDTANLALQRQRNAASMAKAQAMLKSLGYAPIPSVANHCTFPIKLGAARFRDGLAKAGYAVVASSEKDGDWCRLTLGTPEQLDGLEKALRGLA
jgi:histidinol-phosphate aminotransferase